MLSLIEAIVGVGGYEYPGRAPAEAFRQQQEAVFCNPWLESSEKARERREWQEAARTGVASYDRAKGKTDV